MSESGEFMEHLSAAARRAEGQLQGADVAFKRVVSDTRSLQPGDLFVALQGDKFDGHNYLAAAAAAGAVGALVVKGRTATAPLPTIEVEDSLLGLQRYAASWRKTFNIPVLGVTGSNGKTTTKQLLAAVIATRGPVLATEGNLNNHIGVPLMLCRLREKHSAAVIEMGASNPGEIALLAQLAQPAYGIITQAGDAHLEGFISREGVAKAKGELFAALNNGTAIINGDDPYAPLWMQLAGANRVITFGLSAHCDVRAESLTRTDTGSAFMLITPQGRAAASIPLAGAHNVMNALAAASGGHALGLTPIMICQGLGQVAAPKGRVAIHTLHSGARLIDDTYNANPTSLAAAIQLLATEPGSRILVLGDMAELGNSAEALHADAGLLARNAGLEGLFTLGPLSRSAAKSFGAGGHAFNQFVDLVEALRPALRAGVTLLVKGSRSARMERVVAELLNQEAH